MLQLSERVVSERVNEIDLEACRWVVVLERGPLSTAQQLEFDRWLASDIRHQGAFWRAQAACRSFDQLGAVAGTRTFSLAATPVTRRRVIAAALSAASLAGVGAWLGTDWFANSPMRYTTAIGEERRVVLPDRSEMVLNTATDLFVRYSRSHRDVQLTRGEVLFTIAQDLARPFVVRTAQWLVRAIEPSDFAVRAGDVDSIRVTVTDGNVEMLSVASGEAQEPQRLPAQHEATVGRSGIVQLRPVSSQEIQRQLAWRKGMIVFDGEPLHEAIVEMNRYRVLPLLIEDPALAEQRIVGAFPMHDPDAFLSALQASLGVRPLSTSRGVLLRQDAVVTRT